MYPCVEEEKWSILSGLMIVEEYLVYLWYSFRDKKL